MYLIRISSSGRAELCKTSGSLVRGICGDAVSGDVNENLGLIVITRKNKRVELYKLSGGYLKSICNDGLNARWSGDEIAVTTTGNRIKIYKSSGSYLRQI